MSALPQPMGQSSGLIDDLTALKLYAKRGDPSAFDVLAQRYQAMVLATCRRVLGNETDAEDAAQETFLKLARHAGSIRSHAGAWLHAAAMGCSIDLMRRAESRRRAERAAGVVERAEQVDRSAEYALWSEIEPMLDEAIASLDEADRELIVGRFLCDRSQQEMAVELGVSDGTVQRRTTKALGKLQKRLNAKGFAIGGAAVLGGALGYSTAGKGSALLAGSISKIGLVGIAGQAAKPALMSKGILVGAAAAVVVGVLSLSVMHVGNGNGGGIGGVFGFGGVAIEPGPERPSGTIGPFEIVSAGEPSLFSRGVWIRNGVMVVNHGFDPESEDVKSARIRIDRMAESDDDGVVLIEGRVDRILPLGDPWSRFKMGQRVEISAEFDDVGRMVLTPLTDGLQLGRNEPRWFGVRPPLGWNERAQIPDDAGEFGLIGPWTEAERIPFTITNREIKFGAESWTAANYRIIEWTPMEGYSRVLSVNAGGRDPRLIGTRFRLLVRKDEEGYSIAYFIPGSEQSDQWPSSFEYSEENPVQVVTIAGDDS